MRESLRRRRVAVLASVLLLNCTLLASGAQAARIGFELVAPGPIPSQITLAPGETIRLVVVVSEIPASGLAAFEMSIEFDPDLIALADPNFGSPFAMFVPLGGQSFCALVRGTQTCEDPNWFLSSTSRTPVLATQSIDNSGGILKMAYGTQPGGAPPSGMGVLALFDVTATGALGLTSLDLSAVILADASEPPVAFSVIVENASLLIVPQPGTANLLFAGLLLLASRRRITRTRR